MPEDTDAPYVVGTPPRQQSATATFAYKAPSPGTTGGGYPKWRSYEHRPETARQGKEDVHVPVHRLAAVAWLLPDGTLGEDVRLSALDGVDVHHCLGMPAANLEDELQLRDHADHSSVTQAQIRAWGADAKRRATADGGTATVPDPETCVECGDAYDGDGCGLSDRDGRYCLACATALAGDGTTIEL